MVDDLTDRALEVAVGPRAVVILTQGPVALTQWRRWKAPVSCSKRRVERWRSRRRRRTTAEAPSSLPADPTAFDASNG